MSNNILVQCKYFKLLFYITITGNEYMFIGRRGMGFLINNRIDVLDTEGKFLEARVIDVSSLFNKFVRIYF